MNKILNGLEGMESSLESKKDENIDPPRHGETSWNTLGRLQGRTDIELNENGDPPRKKSPVKIKKMDHFDLAIVSPLKRGLRHRRTGTKSDRNIPILLMDERIEESASENGKGLCCRRENYQIPSKRF